MGFFSKIKGKAKSVAAKVQQKVPEKVAQAGPIISNISGKINTIKGLTNILPDSVKGPINSVLGTVESTLSKSENIIKTLGIGGNSDIASSGGESAQVEEGAPAATEAA